MESLDLACRPRTRTLWLWYTGAQTGCQSIHPKLTPSKLLHTHLLLIPRRTIWDKMVVNLSASGFDAIDRLLPGAARPLLLFLHSVVFNGIQRVCNFHADCPTSLHHALGHWVIFRQVDDRDGLFISYLGFLEHCSRLFHPLLVLSRAATTLRSHTNHPPRSRNDSVAFAIGFG